MGWFAFITGHWSKAPAPVCGPELAATPARAEAALLATSASPSAAHSSPDACGCTLGAALHRSTHTVGKGERTEPCTARADAPRPNHRSPKLKTKQAGDAGPSARKGSARLVISGRMADVCAELERLAANEARLCGPLLH